MRKLFAALILTTLVFSSCSRNECSGSKKAFLKKYNDLVETVMDHDLDYSDREWEKYDEQFRTYVEDCYDEHEPEMTRRERREFWSKAMGYYYKRYGDGVVNELMDESSRLAAKIRENTEEFWHEHGDELEEILENLGDNLEDVFSKFEDDIEDWARKLEEIIEK